MSNCGYKKYHLAKLCLNRCLACWFNPCRCLNQEEKDNMISRVKNNFEIDTREYGVIDVPRPTYKFTAFCTSDECRLIDPTNKNRTDVGKRKEVSRTIAFCSECGYALFWQKDVA